LYFKESFQCKPVSLAVHATLHSSAVCAHVWNSGYFVQWTICTIHIILEVVVAASWWRSPEPKCSYTVYNWLSLLIFFFFNMKFMM